MAKKASAKPATKAAPKKAASKAAAPAAKATTTAPKAAKNTSVRKQATDKMASVAGKVRDTAKATVKEIKSMAGSVLGQGENKGKRKK